MTHVPIVKRLTQWDWQGHALPDARRCEQPTKLAHPRTGTACGNVAKYEIDGTAMCMRHAKAHVLHALDPESSADTNLGAK
jgi:hypothetical protein